MQISQNDWKSYIEKLRAINEKAADLVQKWIDRHGTDDMQELIAYALAVSNKYGEAAAELACEMYDAIAMAEGMILPAAVPALTAPEWEIRKALYGSSDLQKAGAVSRLVKRTAADTTLQNAARDGAEFAWIPAGDTCSFCLTLASRGWQTISKKTLRNGHAEHIHGHCDCQYAIRFSARDNVAGYDPDKYLEMYNDAGKDINAMRRMRYAETKDERNARRREQYAAQHNKD